MGRNERVSRKGRSKPRIRKEFIFLSLGVLAFVAMFLFSKAGSGRPHYDGDNVTLNFNSGDTYQQSDGPEYEYDDSYEVVDGSSANNPNLGNPDLVADKDADDISEPVIDAPGDEGGAQGEGDDGVESSGDADSEPSNPPDTTVTRPSAQQFVDMLINYLCGREDPLFGEWLSGDMREKFGTMTDTEPYSTLNGVKSVTVLDIKDTQFSFKLQDGTKYTFNVLFDGNLVSGLEVSE